MPTLEFVCDLDAPIARVWQFHDTIETLFKLTPPGTQARLDGDAVPMRPGVVYHLKIRRYGIPIPTWYARIVAYEPPNRFVDTQEPGHGPFKAWQHEHLFMELPDNRTRLTDRVTYEVPLGPLGKIADALFVRGDIQKMFAYRHRVTREAVERKGDGGQEVAARMSKQTP